MPPADEANWRRFVRHMQNSKREITKAVERASAVDLREGHIAEARRRLEEVRRAADDAIETLRG